MTNNFTEVNTTGLKESIIKLAKAYAHGAEHAKDFSVNQDDYNAIQAIFEGSKEYEEYINTGDCVGMEVEDISNTDVLYYLEEMIQSGLADEVEENVYYDIKLMNKCKKGELKLVKKNMMKMYDEKF